MTSNLSNLKPLRDRLTIGIETEAQFKTSQRRNLEHGSWHTDTSVCVPVREEDRNTTGDCYCDNCRRCSHCDYETPECECDSCRECVSCGYHPDDCECDDDDQEFEWNCEDTYMDCDNNEYCECGTNGVVNGEIVSRILKWKHPHQVRLFIDESKPYRVDDECGRHEHVGGLTAWEYAQLMSQEFNVYSEKILHRWGMDNKINEGTAFWKRLGGKIHWCRNKFVPSSQVELTYKENARYMRWNFWRALKGTIECRMLPTFQKNELNFRSAYIIPAIIRVYLANKRAEFKSIQPWKET